METSCPKDDVPNPSRVSNKLSCDPKDEGKQGEIVPPVSCLELSKDFLNLKFGRTESGIVRLSSPSSDSIGEEGGHPPSPRKKGSKGTIGVVVSPRAIRVDM